ncbi:MAG: type I-E CRISPR-associated protein Cas5/CasD [Pseudomonadota bacterium]
MVTLLLRLTGPMQSWGTTSRFDERDTGLEPSKSGVIGLLCAALGRDRSAPVDDLARLRMGVRVDREGVLLRDFQTATGVLLARGKKEHERTVVSPRYFLSDASFLVGLEGDDVALLSSAHAALVSPVWPLFLGRKAFPPGEPIWLPDGLRDSTLHDALTSYPALGAARMAEECRFIFETDGEGALRMDQPMAPFSERRFGPRFVR